MKKQQQQQQQQEQQQQQQQQQQQHKINLMLTAFFDEAPRSVLHNHQPPAESYHLPHLLT
jgi:hypothetical protein